MKRFEAQKACLLFMVLLSVFIVLPGCGGGDDTCVYPLSSSKAITAFSFAGLPGNAGTINEPAKTIEVTLPFGTDVTNLIATFTTTGKVVRVGSVVQNSGTTPNNFTSPVVYTVTAANGSTVTYTVNVTVATISAKAITAFSFAGVSGVTGVINELSKTIAVAVPFGTNVTNLIANFTTSGTSVRVGVALQTSGTTSNDFTSPLEYTVTAADASTAMYTVTVTVAPISAKAITAFSFVGFSGAVGTINEVEKTIAVTVPLGTNVTALVATYTTTGTGVRVGSAVQTSGTTPNNFTNPVAYTVTAADASTATYVVSVSVAPISGKTITAFSFVGFPGAVGTINEVAKTIAVTVPLGTDLTTLIATFTTTGTIVRVGSIVQTSGVTPNNFTNPVAYTVTAADSSTATYTVTVTMSNAPIFGTAAVFGTFGGVSGMTNQGTLTVINGDIGTTATDTTSITGFHDTEGDIFTETGSNVGAVNGTIYTCTNSTTGPNSAAVNAAYCAIATQGRLDALAAYNALVATPTGGASPAPGANLAGLTLLPGVYTAPAGSFMVEGGDLTLDAQGNANAVWVFQMATTLTVGGPGAASPQSIILTNGAQAKNIFWQVGSFATINAAGGGTMVGTIISQEGASFSTAGNAALVTLEGRVLSLGASVTLVNTIINVPAP